MSRDNYFVSLKEQVDVMHAVLIVELLEAVVYRDVFKKSLAQWFDYKVMNFSDLRLNCFERTPFCSNLIINLSTQEIVHHFSNKPFPRFFGLWRWRIRLNNLSWRRMVYLEVHRLSNCRVDNFWLIPK